jgi:hypothetical protein
VYPNQPGVRSLKLDGAPPGLVHLPGGDELLKVVRDSTLRRHPVVGRLVVVDAELKASQIRAKLKDKGEKITVIYSRSL